MAYTSIFSLKIISRTPKRTTETVRDLTFLLGKKKNILKKKNNNNKKTPTIT